MPHISKVLEDIQHAVSTQDLWHILLDYFHAQGVTMASYHAVDANQSTLQIATDGFPEDWVCTYIEQNLVKVDPIPELAARRSEPFYWHEIRDLVPQDADTDRYLSAFEKSGIGDGLAFYVFGPGLQNAYVGLGFGKDRIELDPEKVFEFQCIAQSGHLKYCALSSQSACGKILSKREKQVLNWVARGKSNAVIADILGVSPHTIDAHMRSIYRKLNVGDRTSAAIRGVGSGLLPIPA